MSDSDEYEYEYDSDEQLQSDSEGEATDGDEAATGQAQSERSAVREAAIELENTFYEAEDFRQRGDWAQAMEYFQRVVTLEKDAIPVDTSVKWSFQALGQIVKLCVARRQWDDMVRSYEEMLTFLPHVTRNDSTDAISSILDVVSAHSSEDTAAYISKVRLLLVEAFAWTD